MNHCGHFRIIRLLFPVIQSLKGSLVLKVYLYYNLPLVKLFFFSIALFKIFILRFNVVEKKL